MEKYFRFERLNGMDEIRMAINPDMTEKFFYMRYRAAVDPILMENPNWTNKKIKGARRKRFYTYRRLLYAVLLIFDKPKRKKNYFERDLRKVITGRKKARE